MDRQCVRCVNDQSVPNISFDEAGVCSFCLELERWRDRLADIDGLHEIWVGKLKSYGGQGPYDAVCGLSGGKDSTYVLYQLVRTYGLKVKAFSFVNGFLTDWARQSIERIVDDLGVDHVFLELPREQMAALQLFSLHATGGICTACAYATFASMLSLATEGGIPIAVHGRSPAQMLRFFAPKSRDPFIPLIYSALRSAEAVDLRETYESVIAAMKHNIPPEHLKHFEHLFPDFENKRAAELVPYFLYHRYDELEIVEFLERNTRWQRPERYAALAHFDCLACDASNYLSELAEGRPHIMPEVAGMVRLGKMTRDEGLERLERERFTAPPEASLQQLAGFLQKPVEALSKIATSVGIRAGTRPPE